MSASLMITPMIDMFTVILIFLIVSYAPEQSRIQKSEQIELPQEDFKLSRLPTLQVEVTETYVSMNGVRIELNNPQAWGQVEAQLQEFKRDSRETAGLLIADQSTPYRLIDRTIGHLSASGFSEIYFLTQEENKP